MLVYAPVTVEERYARKVGKGVGGYLPPLGLAALAAYVRDRGFSVDVIDSLGLGLGVEDVVTMVKHAGPAVVGFSAMTVNYHRACACAERIRQELPDSLIIIGGAHATLLPEEVLAEAPFLDVAVVGEGELTLHDLLRQYKSGGCSRATFLNQESAMDDIPGIVYRTAGGVKVTRPRPHIQDLDSLPLPARDLLPMGRYMPLPNQYLRLPVAHMTAIRGCPYRCTFCSASTAFGRRIRAKSPARAVDEIEHLMREYGAREISFWDDTMTANRKWMLEFCDEIVRRKLDVTWTGYSRVDTVDAEMLRRMKAAGCWNLFYGFEAGDQTLLDIIEKGITLEQIRSANRLTQEAGIEVRASFMIALPGETPELAQKTIEFAKELNPDYAQFSITTPYPGTRLWETAGRYGTLDKDYRHYHGWTPVFVPSGYASREQIMQMEKRAMRQFYLRPAFFWKTLRKLRSWEDAKRYLKGFRMVLGFV